MVITAAVFCIAARFPQCFSDEDTAVLTAAAFTLSDGTVKPGTEETSPAQQESSASAMGEEKVNIAENTESSQLSALEWGDYYNTYASHEGEKKYDITEKNYTGYGTQYENFFVENKTDYDLNIGEMLTLPLGFETEKTEEPQVLIMHTHTCESYLDADEGYFFESYYPRCTDSRFNVTRVGAAIADSLQEQGVGAIHDATIHDYPSYNGSYDRSLETIYSYIEEYPSIKVVLDIHRDSLGSETNKIKPAFTYKGKKGAQIMILAGCDDGTLDFPDWNYNLRFALRLQKQTETMFPGMTRPLDFGYFSYNMSVNTGSLLVEIGTDANTLEEAVYSGKLFGQSLAKVLQS